MTQKKQITLVLLYLLSVLTMGIWTSCGENNSESVITRFFPANSIVRSFTHAVYVEFSQGDIRVWGPYSHEVEVEADAGHLSLINHTDSLALILYGFPSANDSASVSNYNIAISSNCDYALYLNKLTLRSQQKPVISSGGNVTCYLVLPNKSKNVLSSVQSPAVIEHVGALVISGEGELSLTNNASRQQGFEPAALIAHKGLLCQYNVKLSMTCPEGDAIRVSGGPLRSSLGTWTFDAGQHAISNPGDSIILIAGTYSGIARQGKFFNNSIGTVIRQAKVEGLSAMKSDLLDTLTLHQHYDSTYVTLQHQFQDTIIKADSLLNITIKGSKNPVAKFTPRSHMQNPWVVLSNSSLHETDTLTITK